MASALECPRSRLVASLVAEESERASGPASNPPPFSPPSEPSTPATVVRGAGSPWAGSGLDKQVIKNLDAIPLSPEELHQRIVRCILQAHHLEIVVPPGSSTTHAVQAALISFVASKLNDTRSSPPHASPTVLVLCVNTTTVERHCAAVKLLGTAVEGLEVGHVDHHESLSEDLELARTSVNRPIWITTLARSGILLQQQVLSIDRLSVLVLDLRDSNQLNHHTVAELEPLINSLGSHVQLIMLLSLNARVSPALSSLVTGKMEASIRINLNNHSTPSLSPASLSSTPSQPFSQIPSPPPATNPTIINVEHDYQGKNQVENISNDQLERHRFQSSW